MILLDIKITQNFMSYGFMRRTGLKIKRKKQPYPLKVANKEKMPNKKGIKNKTLPLLIFIQQHREIIQFNILKITTHNLILGMP